MWIAVLFLGGFFFIRKICVLTSQNENRTALCFWRPPSAKNCEKRVTRPIKFVALCWLSTSKVFELPRTHLRTRMTGIYRHVQPAEGLNSYPPGIAMPALSAEKAKAVVKCRFKHFRDLLKCRAPARPVFSSAGLLFFSLPSLSLRFSPISPEQKKSLTPVSLPLFLYFFSFPSLKEKNP